MAPLCLLYFVAVGFAIGVAALLVEQSLAPETPRRWLWCVSIIASLIAPPMTGIFNALPALEIFGISLISLSPSHAHSSTALNWFVCAAGYGQIALKMWLVGMITLAGFGVLSALRVARLTRAGSTTIVDGVDAVLTESVGPATVGIWKARVLIPKWVIALPETQRQYVLRHEDEHRRAKDARLLVVMSVLVALWPWNISLWWQLRRLRLAVEVDCDRRVVSSLGNARGYGELLLRVAENGSRAIGLQPAFLGAGMLEGRIRRLVAMSPRRLAFRVAAVAVAVSVLAFVASVPHPDATHLKPPVASDF